MFRDHIPPHRFHSILHAIGRRGGRHGFGRGFGDSFGRGFGGGDFPTGRKLGSEDLQLVLLALLAERPAHGYEMIRLLEERSGGFYTPSPGMIYPALTYLDEIGYAAVTQDGNRKLYTLTEAGRAHLEAYRAQADAILDTLARIGGRMAEVREAFAGVDADDPQAADELHQARHTLKRALMRKRGCSPDEARRIAQILARAATEIAGGAG
ncbi:PadR family transcriptional regulator [Gluconacetobacter azotocaptans]|uniref:PadR family transcriptional regulator n=1 Tax=Gluconacetobacter azotocaptans TaxID=142834 RepID=A0A7W4JQC3_9PROT|nr:PadR family transcriptional regulator [Gluconacetobacter azotocaptans]MBB2188928.1 PadR family transcriptional regulator [Gluconacetobacter azotocaptans]MBM9401500.1 PadR family transcriptional regulator [Gluconacetobacter azotocaptans]GBQ25987.1 putative transcriptional regulator [Gluconacetobacter azotocaptans DSM 13594]